MSRIILMIAAAAAVATAPMGAHGSGTAANPLEFFEGRTESVGTIKVIMRKPFQSRSIGRGRILPDGTLDLVQTVEQEGKPPHERRWQIHRVGAGHYAGSMSDAQGPVTIDDLGNSYRFRFRMKEGNLPVEQYMIPLPGGKSARNTLTIKKFGMTVVRSDGIIRKLD